MSDHTFVPRNPIEVLNYDYENINCERCEKRIRADDVCWDAFNMEWLCYDCFDANLVEYIKGVSDLYGES